MLSANPLEEYTEGMKSRVLACCMCLLLSEGTSQKLNGCGALRGLCCMTHVFYYCSFSNISAGLVASQSVWGWGLDPPEIDLFLHPNCLLNIIDHQRCHREEGKKGAATRTAKKGSFLWKAIYLKNVLVRPALEAEKEVIFQPLILPHLVAAGLIRARFIINVISRLEWNSRLTQHSKSELPEITQLKYYVQKSPAYLILW